MDFEPDTVVRSSRRQVSTQLGDEAIVLGMTTGEYFGLEEVGTLVWERLGAPVEVGAIESAILEAYDVTPERCHADLVALLAELEGKGLIERVQAG